MYMYAVIWMMFMYFEICIMCFPCEPSGTNSAVSFSYSGSWTIFCCSLWWMALLLVFLLQEVFGSTCIFIALHRSMLRLERLVLITYNVLYYGGIIFLTLTTIYYIDLLWFFMYCCWHLLYMLVMKFCSQRGWHFTTGWCIFLIFSFNNILLACRMQPCKLDAFLIA